jgi:hypothetical protein
VLKFIVEGMRELPGRKSLILMSDMVPIETNDPATSIVTPGEVLADVRMDYTEQLKKVAEKAIRSSVVSGGRHARPCVYRSHPPTLFHPGPWRQRPQLRVPGNNTRVGHERALVGAGTAAATAGSIDRRAAF